VWKLVPKPASRKIAVMRAFYKSSPFRDLGRWARSRYGANEATGERLPSARRGESSLEKRSERSHGELEEADSRRLGGLEDVQNEAKTARMAVETPPSPAKKNSKRSQGCQDDSRE
jgi:hypothetical protein